MKTKLLRKLRKKAKQRYRYLTKKDGLFTIKTKDGYVVMFDEDAYNLDKAILALKEIRRLFILNNITKKEKIYYE